MANKILAGAINTPTPQSEKADPKQKKNLAGGYTYTVEGQARLRRFLVLGTEGSAFYSNPRDLAKQNLTATKAIIAAEGLQSVATILDVSTRGLAPRQDATLLALAIASSVDDATTRSAALTALPKVARTATMLFDYLTYVKQFRGTGRALRTAISNWYTGKDADAVALQITKYRQRNGWTHRDVLRIAHPQVEPTSMHSAAFRFALDGRVSGKAPKVIDLYTQAQTEGTDLAALVRENREVAWEHLPTDALREPKVWEAFLDRGMPLTALLRNLPRLAELGVTAPLNKYTQAVVTTLTDKDALRKARIHPLQVLIAQRQYQSGQSRSGLSYKPVPQIVAALEEAFHLSFETVPSAGKRTLVGLDVSGSMSWSHGLPGGLMSSEIGAAIGLTILKTEPQSHLVGFAHTVRDLGITKADSLESALSKTSRLTFGSTDAAAAIQYALDNKIDVDTFVIITDNETWAGRKHPHVALQEYRKKTGIDARVIVLATEASEFSIAKGPEMLDIPGFSADVPAVITAFSKGEI